MCCPCLNERLTSLFHYPSSVPFTHSHTHSTLLHRQRHSRERQKDRNVIPVFFFHTPNLFTSPRCNQTRPLSHEAITSGIRLSLPSRSSHPSLQPRSRNNNHHRHRSPQSSFWVSLQVSRDRFIIPRNTVFRKQHISTCTLPSLLTPLHLRPSCRNC